MSTPALDRATEAICPGNYCEGHSECHRDALAAVSAALHDPDDPDWLARVIYDAHGFHSADTWDTDHDGVRNHYRGHADAVRAAILGEAS